MVEAVQRQGRPTSAMPSMMTTKHEFGDCGLVPWANGARAGAMCEPLRQHKLMALASRAPPVLASSHVKPCLGSSPRVWLLSAELESPYASHDAARTAAVKVLSRGVGIQLGKQPTWSARPARDQVLLR